jgi:hypothetical protein
MSAKEIVVGRTQETVTRTGKTAGEVAMLVTTVMTKEKDRQITDIEQTQTLPAAANPKQITTSKIKTDFEIRSKEKANTT